MKRLNFENIAIVLGISYLILPICIFFMGWLNTFLGLILSLLFIYLGYKLYLTFKVDENNLFKKKNLIYWFVSLLLICIWVYFSGIGGFSYQNDDFWARNAIFRDLINYDWPVIYDLSIEPEYVTNLLGTSKVAFSYYYIFWLPVALISKVFKLSWAVSNYFLYVYVVIGILLTLYFLNRKFKKCSYVALVLLICFSGLDVIRYIIRNGVLPTVEHIEWYGDFFYQYSSNTTQLFWIFNQSVMVWLIMSMFINIDNHKYTLALCALTFAYSPWAMIGLLPYMLVVFVKNIKNSINATNICVCLIMLIIFGSFYFSGTKGSNPFHISFLYFDGSYKAYIMLVLLEFGLYYLLIGKKNYEYYYVTLISLLFIPFIQDESLNFCMRVSIPALFMLMYYVASALYDNNGIKRILLIVLLMIGSYTPFTEVYRSIRNKLDWPEYIIRDEINSFGNTQYNGDDKEDSIKMISDQFFAYEYKDSFFFKYLAKKVD